MAIINVKIKHINYQLSCHENQVEEVNKLLERIKSRINQIEKKAPHASEGQLLLMTALKLEEELLSKDPDNILGSNNNSESSDEMLADSFDAISDYLETLAKKLEMS